MDKRIPLLIGQATHRKIPRRREQELVVVFSFFSSAGCGGGYDTLSLWNDELAAE